MTNEEALGICRMALKAFSIECSKKVFTEDVPNEVGKMFAEHKDIAVMVDSLKRLLPMKPIGTKFKGRCPKCDHNVFPHMNFCDVCGQALRWHE